MYWSTCNAQCAELGPLYATQLFIAVYHEDNLFEHARILLNAYKSNN